MTDIEKRLLKLATSLRGDLFIDNISRIIHATDASAYREIPLAVARPKNIDDIRLLITFANANHISLIPRAAGTSLAGQVVGNGIVVDISKHFTEILEINQQQHWVRVQPGVVLDELNQILEPLGLFFGPETSTSNRCMIGGMVGNNSCGSHSIIYGSTRDHTLEVKALISDGSELLFKDLTDEEFHKKCELNNFEGKLYRSINDILSVPFNQNEIRSQFPETELKRRNNGYAIDLLLETNPFVNNGIPFNFSKLIAGSEGTLAFITEIKLNLVPLPPIEKAVICIHLNTVEEALEANLIALRYNPGAVELMDSVILNCTKGNITQQRNRFFVEGDPGAILIAEFARETKREVTATCENLISELKSSGYGYHFPILFGSDIAKVWALRKSGLGVLSNIPGDAKPVSVVEDTAVIPKLLPSYIKEFNQILERYKVTCVFHAHVGSGELHLRPVINLKDAAGVNIFRSIALETAQLVKKYRGSISGEHGDGRLRGEFISLMIGEHNYQLIKDIKKTWDPNNIFNARKIIDTPPMSTQLRYDPDHKTRDIKTIFNFSDQQGVLRAAENCNGSGDCRKSSIIGGTMCPSYMATRNEQATTRARANILREFLTKSTKANPFNHKEIYEIMDLCLSCKACKSECPSNVDMAKLKAEFLQHYYDSNGVPLRTFVIGYVSKINQFASHLSTIYNGMVTNKITSYLIKKSLGFAANRSMPLLANQTLIKWTKKNLPQLNSQLQSNYNQLYIFIDEFTNFNDVEVGKTAIMLLHKLGYYINYIPHKESGRTFISKGLLRKAKKLAIHNVNIFKDIVTEQKPLIGIEPSCILTFRDEYPDLVHDNNRAEAKKLGTNAMFIDEFIAKEIDNGKIKSAQFTNDVTEVSFHAHCQQKALITSECTRKILSLPVNYSVKEIKSGCCGMAGSFGYEKEHYDLSMKIGELVLFPKIRSTALNTIIAAPGTSCRCHIKDGTGKIAKHPVEVLYEALNKF